MKKIIIAILILLSLITPKTIFAQEAWVIENFDVSVKIEDSGEVKINETIRVDFSVNEKHGIFRDIPYVYSSPAGEVYTEIDVGDVLQDGKKAQVQTSKNDNNLRIRIGNPDETISGKHVYEINYTARGIIKSFDNHEELYWNVTGNAWEAPILKTSTSVTSFIENVTQVKCFDGYESESNECQAEIFSGKSAAFSSITPLSPGQGMTMVVGFERGSIPILIIEKPVSFFEKLISLPSRLTILFTLISGSLVVFWMWWKYGRDFHFPGIAGYKNESLGNKVKPLGAHEAVIVEYTPPEDLPPGIIGVVADEQANTLDVTSTIIDLAGRGFLEIKEVPKKWMFGKKDYVLINLQKDTTNLYSYEKELLKRLFEGKEEQTVSSLKTKFYTDLAKVKEKLYAEVVRMNFFETNPEKVRGKYLIIGVLLLAASIGGIVISLANELVFLADLSIAGFFISLIIIVFSRFMPRRTAQGRDIYRRIKGYRLFIETAEKHRQKFFEDKNMFNQVLPYAIIFGLTDKFANAMREMGIKPTSPTWYHGAHAFNAAAFSGDLSDFSNSLSTAISSAPSSSGFSGGGGSSGGGFGGGGGGSW